MLPILFNFGSFTLYTYGVFAVLAFFWFLYISWKLLRITSHKEEDLFDKIFIAMGIGLVVGRMAYVIFNYDIVFKKGIMAIFAVHLYPGFHGFTVVASALISLIVIVRNKKYTGSEIASYIIPAICIAMAIINIGALFSGSVVGTPTDFALRVKYAIYDNLRHVPTLYRAIAFAIMAYISYRALYFIRTDKVSHEVVVTAFIWFFALINALTMPLIDVLTYGRNVGYRLYDIYLSVFTLLTAFGVLMYHWRSYFLQLFKFTRKG